MDRQPPDYAAAAMAYAQAQAQAQQQAPQYGYHPQAQAQYPPHPHAAPPPPYAAPPLPQYAHAPYPRAMPPQAYAHLPPHQQPPPPFGAHPPPPHVMSTPSPPPHPSYMHPPPPFDSAPPPPAAPPADPELQKRIDKLVEYTAKNGPDFEAMIRDKQHDNPDYAFVFGGEGHAYYRYKLWLSARPPVAPYPAPAGSMHMMPPMMRAPPMHQPPYAPFYDPHQQFAAAHGHGEYETAAKFKGLSGPLPPDVAAELQEVLNNLNGTKESIKGAKAWFMQRSPFAPALAEALRERVFALEDSERQLHIIFLVNDILFESLQRRSNVRDLDNEAIAFKSVLGSMLARIYNNPQSKDDSQTRVEKILQFWGSKEVYDLETISNFEREMKSGVPYPIAPRHVSPDPSAFSASAQVPSKWSSEPPEKDKAIHLVSAPPQSLASAQFSANQLPAGVYPPGGQTTFPVSLPGQPSLPPAVLPQTIAPATANDSAPPPYPLFPPGLIPGMVRKMQIGSGVPYSPLSPLDIPTVIPPSTIPESDILERVSKFFREIGEVNPSEGPMKQGEPDDYDDYERELPARKGGACIPPPPNLLVNPETGMRADGSVDSKPGSSGRLGLGASADPNEVSQYDDVYSSYRKHRSTTYHSSITARSTTR